MCSSDLREMAADNKILGQFDLVGIPPAPRGMPQIEVTFDIDANGIVHVSAKDRGTGKEQSLTITGQSTLNKDDIDRMVKDAEAHAEEDRQRREEAEVRNNADSLVYQTEKLLKDNADKIDEADKALIQAPLDQAKAAMNGNDLAAIKSAHEALSAAAQQFGQKLYEKASAEQAAGTSASGAAGSTGNDDDIIDAEIVDES